VIGERRWWWYGRPGDGPPTEPKTAALSAAATVTLRHVSVRSAWFLSGVRGAVALTAAIAIADLTGVQHGFWVVLGTLSVLRTNAAPPDVLVALTRRQRSGRSFAATADRCRTPNLARMRETCVFTVSSAMCS
jgi:hypothetical protein